ncbi:lysosome-associated membrane glycoprotein 1-like [Anopheles cruzii]|uniref:lysosome-associated membrane glycoprotein 1-like n=1 Tax=Anopheles cruzii TaxID=68878 RepID=UPI0022EC2B57|nr:lysosome-associated membrane glycoprotein 1-like [Anopheles cruzii]
MHPLRVSFVCLLVVAGLAICNAQNETTTVKPTTPTPETTTTPTPSPNSTTTTSTTTMAPTTTTAVPPTPKPVPEPEMGMWSYAESNRTCVIVQMAMQFNLSYFDTANKMANVLYNIPKDARVKSGACMNSSDYIELSWFSGNQSNVENTLKVAFVKNATEHDFALAGLQLNLLVVGESFPNAKANQSLQLTNNATLFKTPLQMSYHCSKPQLLNMTSATAGLGQPTVTVTKVQLEAFHEKKDKTFSIAKDCEAIDTPDIVPIAVGCALVTLIIIMLIAYLVGRNNVQGQGYLSM